MASIRDKTTLDISELFDIDPTTVQHWVKLGCPCDKATKRKQSHKFNEAEFAAWMKKANKTGRKGRPTAGDSDELQCLKIRKEAALVAKHERENRVAEELLIDAAGEQQRDIQKITTIRNRLCGLGASLSPQLDGLDGAERQTILDNAIDEILKEFGR